MPDAALIQTLLAHLRGQKVIHEVLIRLAEEARAAFTIRQKEDADARFQGALLLAVSLAEVQLGLIPKDVLEAVGRQYLDALTHAPKGSPRDRSTALQVLPGETARNVARRVQDRLVLTQLSVRIELESGVLIFRPGDAQQAIKERLRQAGL